MNNIWTVGPFSLQTCPDGSKPIAVSLLFVWNKLNTGNTVKIEHGTHNHAHVAENVDEASIRKQLPQTTDVERVFWCSIDPTFFRPSQSAGSLKPTRIDFQSGAPGFAFSFQLLAVAQNQVVDALPQCGEQLLIPNVHGTQNRMIAARRTGLIGQSDVHSKFAQPA